MSKRNLIALISIFFIGIHSVMAQSLKELEAQKRKAQERLEATQKLLDDTQKSRKGTENELQLITRTIKETNNLIFSINSEIDGLNRDISSLATERNALSRKLTVRGVCQYGIEELCFQPTIFARTLHIFIEEFQPGNATGKISARNIVV